MSYILENIPDQFRLREVREDEKRHLSLFILHVLLHIWSYPLRPKSEIAWGGLHVAPLSRKRHTLTLMTPMTTLTTIMTIIPRSCYYNTHGDAFHWYRWVRLHTPIRLWLQMVRKNVWESFKENDRMYCNFGIVYKHCIRKHSYEHCTNNQLCSWLIKDWPGSSVFHCTVVEVRLYTVVIQHYLSIIALFTYD